MYSGMIGKVAVLRSLIDPGFRYGMVTLKPSHKTQGSGDWIGRTAVSVATETGVPGTRLEESDSAE